ncbi:MAG: type I restriction-modification enzyme R subunit C-terminal domain-containing protein [Actinomycetota bacterium]
MKGRALSADQLEFVNLIIDHLTEHGIMDPARLYGSPFTDLTARGPDGLFTTDEVEELVGTLRRVKAAAEAA